MPDCGGELRRRDGRVVLGALERGALRRSAGATYAWISLGVDLGVGVGGREHRRRASSYPLAAATASAGVVMPTVSSPTMPMTPTENDAAVTRRNAAPLLGRDAAARRRARSAASLGAAARRRVWIGRLAGEREEARGGFEFVDVGCLGPRLRDRLGRRLGLDDDSATGSRSSNGSVAGVRRRPARLDDGLEQHEGLGGNEDGVGKRRGRGGRGAAGAEVGQDLLGGRRRLDGDRRHDRLLGRLRAAAGAAAERLGDSTGASSSGRLTEAARRPERQDRCRDRDRGGTAATADRRLGVVGRAWIAGGGRDTAGAASVTDVSERTTPHDGGTLGRRLAGPAPQLGTRSPRGLRRRLDRRGGGAAGAPRGRRLSHGGVERQAGRALGRVARGATVRSSGCRSPSPFGRRR